MPVLQQLRSNTATALPASLLPGQIALNLANNWLLLGNGSADIMVKGAAVSGYGTTATILGVGSVGVPAKPSAGGGYEIFDLEGSGIQVGSSNPAGAASTTGQLFVNTGGSKPALLMYDGSSWVPPVPSPAVYTLTTAEVTAGSGASQSAKMADAVATKEAAVSGTADLNTGDTCIVTGTAATNAAPGSFIWDGSSWVAAGAGLPDATTRTAPGTGGTKGVVYLALDTEVAETGAPGSVAPDSLSVATAAQLKALADRIGALATGHALMGTWDASSGNVQNASPAASTGGRGNMANGDPLGGATGLVAGDYFRVGTGGTPAGLTGAAASLNGTVFTVGDQIVFDGAEWRSFTTPPKPTDTLHGLGDVSDGSVATVASADVKGILVRDGSVANDGDPDAYKLVDSIDLGTF